MGLVSLIALVLIGLGVFAIGNEQRFWEGRSNYRLRFTRANGLQEGAPVALSGVYVGSVSRMSFPHDPRAQYLEVEITVSSDVAPRIRHDSFGKIQTLGMLGDKYVELSAGTLDAEQLEDGGLIPSHDPTDYEAILGKSGDIVSNAIEVTALLRDVLTDVTDGEGLVGRLISDREFGRELSTDLSDALANIESATESADRLIERAQHGDAAIGALLDGGDQVRSILANFETSSAEATEFAVSLNEGEGALPRLVTDKEFADRTFARLEDTTSSISHVADAVRNKDGTLGRLIYDDELYRNVNGLFGGGSQGGFWRLLGKTAGFFLPFSGKSADSAEVLSPPAKAPSSESEPAVATESLECGESTAKPATDQQFWRSRMGLDRTKAVPCERLRSPTR